MLQFFKKTTIVSLLIVAALMAVAGCRSDKQKIIGEKVSERVAAFRAKRIAECSNALLHDAGKIADSLLLEEAKMQLLDSLHAPPFRPPRPAPLLPIDTLEVAPLFQPASSTRQER